jgi:hypothetical protein
VRVVPWQCEPRRCSIPAVWRMWWVFADDVCLNVFVRAHNIIKVAFAATQVRQARFAWVWSPGAALDSS